MDRDDHSGDRPDRTRNVPDVSSDQTGSATGSATGGTVSVPSQRQPVPASPPAPPSPPVSPPRHPQPLETRPVWTHHRSPGERFATWWSRPLTIFVVMLFLLILLSTTIFLATRDITGEPVAQPSPTESASPSPTPALTLMPTPTGAVTPGTPSPAST